MKRMTGKNTLMLFLTAFIWGTAFVAQSVGMDYIGPFTFTCVRSLDFSDSMYLFSGQMACEK